MRQSVHAFTILATLLAATVAQAETWPSRLIKATIPFGPGSAADVVPRLVFDRLSAELGQPIVVENRAGAGGALGSASVAKAEPDGYSILAVLGAHDCTGDFSEPGLRRLERSRLRADDRFQRQRDDRAQFTALEDDPGFHR
jgi:tripartite-type tricarboxylate transporter receptor subunit TctC